MSTFILYLIRVIRDVGITQYLDLVTCYEFNAMIQLCSSIICNFIIHCKSNFVTGGSCYSCDPLFLRRIVDAPCFFFAAIVVQDSSHFWIAVYAIPGNYPKKRVNLQGISAVQFGAKLCLFYFVYTI